MMRCERGSCHKNYFAQKSLPRQFLSLRGKTQELRMPGGWGGCMKLVFRGCRVALSRELRQKALSDVTQSFLSPIKFAQSVKPSSAGFINERLPNPEWRGVLVALRRIHITLWYDSWHAYGRIWTRPSAQIWCSAKLGLPFSFARVIECLVTL